jgi:threonine/homoserine/homoserine lactone efflux protein
VGNAVEVPVNGHLLALYVVAVAVAMVVPGPDMMFVLASGVRSGPRVGFFAAVGVASSEVVHIAAAAVGLSALFATAPAAFTALRIAGAGYLAWLGVHALRSAVRGGSLDESTFSETPVSGRQAYLRGALTNLVNPKMITFSVAFLPQFVDRGIGHVPLQFLLLGVIFLGFELLVDGSVGLLAGRLRQTLARRRRARQALDAGSGTMMLALAGRLALDRP